MLVSWKLFLQTWNKLRDAVDKQDGKDTKINTIKTKVYKIDTKILDATTLIHINQYKKDKQMCREKKLRCW